MRIILFILFINYSVLAQVRVPAESFESLLERGKSEYKEKKYLTASATLRKAVTLNPESAEAHYFLGYAYGRINDENGMNNMRLEWTLRSSEEFEQVIQLTPKYTGEIVVLDPYSKLTAEWGCMAMCYLNANKLDSAVWAFNEGKRRGGFSSFYLTVGRNILNKCSKHALLITSGDNLTINLWYLQTIERYRTDVAVVNIDLLNSTWYTEFLRSKSIVTFDLPKASLDTLEMRYWKDSIVSVRNKYAYKDFSWTVKPRTSEGFIHRNDLLFLSILKSNEFESDVYFSIGSLKEDELSLHDYLLPLILVKKINVNNEKQYSFETYRTEVKEALELAKYANRNSEDQIYFMNSIRYDLLIRLNEEDELGNKKGVKQLVSLLDTYTPEDKFPYWDQEIKNYVAYMRKQSKL